MARGKKNKAKGKGKRRGGRNSNKRQDPRNPSNAVHYKSDESFDLPFVELPWGLDDDEPRHEYFCKPHLKEACPDCRVDYSLMNELRYDPEFWLQQDHFARINHVWNTIRSHYSGEDIVKTEGTPIILSFFMSTAHMCYAAHWKPALQKSVLLDSLSNVLANLPDADESRRIAEDMEGDSSVSPATLPYQDTAATLNPPRMELVCTPHSRQICAECQMDFSLLNRLRNDPDYHELSLAFIHTGTGLVAPLIWTNIRGHYLRLSTKSPSGASISQEQMDAADPITSMAYKCYAAHWQGDDAKQDLLHDMEATLDLFPESSPQEMEGL